jgi:peptidylprolyl isomerase
MTEVKKGDKVKVEYTGKLEDGSVFDSSEGKEPLQFEVGAQQVIPGFEKAVEGMKKDEEKEFTLKSEEAYGPVRPEMVQEVPRDKLPEQPEPAVGMMLMMQAPTGQQIPAKITKVEDGKVTIDVNHPLAGKDLVFKVKVVGINDPEEPKADEAKESVANGEEKKDDDGCGPSDCSSCAGCQ